MPSTIHLILRSARRARLEGRRLPMQQPDVNAKLVTAGLIIANESPEYFDKFIKSEYAKYGKLVRDIGFQPQ